MQLASPLNQSVCSWKLLPSSIVHNHVLIKKKKKSKAALKFLLIAGKNFDLFLIEHMLKLRGTEQLSCCILAWWQMDEHGVVHKTCHPGTLSLNYWEGKTCCNTQNTREYEDNWPHVLLTLHLTWTMQQQELVFVIVSQKHCGLSQLSLLEDKAEPNCTVLKLLL